MKNLTIFLTLMSVAAAQAQNDVPATPTPAPTEPAVTRDAKAIALFEQALAAYKSLKTLAAVFDERDGAGHPTIYQLQWAPPGKAALLIRRMGAQGEGRFVADGKNIFRLLPGSTTFDRIPMRDPSDADGVFTASPLLLFGVAPLLAGKNLANDAKLVREAALGEIPANAASSVYAAVPVDVVRLRLALPGDPPAKLTSLIYAFDRQTHHLQRLWLEREIGGKKLTASLEVGIESPNATPKADAFVWKAPPGVKEVPFAGLLAPPLTPPVAPPVPQGIAVDPAAVALFDRAAKLYAGAKTLRLRWKTLSPSPLSDSDDADHVTIVAFARPNRIAVERKSEYSHELYLVDGRFLWSLDSEELIGATYSRQPVAQGAGALRETLSNLLAALGPGATLAGWLQGQHELQPAQLKEWRKPGQGAAYFEAKRLAPANWKGRSWERVRIRYRFGSKTEAPGLSVDETFWLAPDNARLVKLEERNEKGEPTDTHEILEQTFNAAIPASTFVFKAPRGAKKE